MCSEVSGKPTNSEPLGLFGEVSASPARAGRPTAKFTENQWAIIAAELGRGTKRKEIARLINCSEPTLRKYLAAVPSSSPTVAPDRKKLLMSRPSTSRGAPRFVFSPEAVVVLVTELSKQTPLHVIAARLGCSKSTLFRRFSKLPCWNPRGFGVRK